MNKLELTPFMAVMRMVKLEFASQQPEIYKMLVSVLHDYNPASGPQHKLKVCSRLAGRIAAANITILCILCDPGLPNTC